MYKCILPIIILFSVLSDDTSWSSGHNISPRSRNLWVGASAGLHFLLISAAESVRTWVREVEPLVDEVQACWTCILSCFIFTFICYIFFYFVFSRFVQSFRVYSSFSLPYILEYSSGTVHFLCFVFPQVVSFREHVAENLASRFNPTLPAFMKNLRNRNKLISPTRNQQCWRNTRRRWCTTFWASRTVKSKDRHRGNSGLTAEASRGVKPEDRSQGISAHNAEASRRV